MDFLRRIEDDVKAISACSGVKEVKEAGERALVTLKSMRDAYVAEVMKKTLGSDGPKLAKFRSIHIATPYLLVCSLVDSNLNSKLVMMALNGIQMLLDFEVLPPEDTQHIVDVLTHQASSGRSEVQMKVLQIELQLANSVANEQCLSEYFTDATVKALLTLALGLCDGTTVSVSSTGTSDCY